MARETLETLLAVWACVGANDPDTDAELVTAIEVAGARAADGLALPEGEDWLAIARRGDPVERGLLLASVEEAPAGKVTARWAAIAAFDDPRVSGLLAQRPAPLRRKDELERFLKVFVAAARDRRIVDAIARVAKTKFYNTAKEQMVEEAQRRIKAEHRAAAKASKPMTPDEAALVRATIAADGGAREASATREAELLAAIYAAPLDDGPREILADWLLERGDPRGEFITLQLASEKRALTADERAREQELLAAHRHAWLGPLAAREVQFRRGFPYAIYWYQDLKLPDDPRWSTVEVAARMPPPSGQRVLRHLTRARSEDLARLGELAADSPLEHIVWYFNEPEPARDAAIAAYRGAKLPSLTSFRITAPSPDNGWAPARIGWLFEGRALTHVEVPGDLRQLAAYLAIFEAHAPVLERLVIHAPLGHTWITKPDGKLHVSISAVQTAAIEAAHAGLDQLAPNALGGAKISTTSKAARTRDRFAAVLARHAGCVFEYGT